MCGQGENPSRVAAASLVDPVNGRHTTVYMWPELCIRKRQSNPLIQHNNSNNNSFPPVLLVHHPQVFCCSDSSPVKPLFLRLCLTFVTTFHLVFLYVFMNWLFSCRLKRKDFHGQRYFGRIKNSILIAVVEQLNFHHTTSQ
jgi:hypothetical protein